MSSSELYADDLIDTHWPRSGPYSEQLTEQAGAGIAQLLRYLNYATRTEDTATTDALPFASTGSAVLNNLGLAAHRLTQLLEQLRGFYLGLAASEVTLYDDRHDDSHSGSATTIETAQALGVATLHAGRLAEALDQAAEHASHLGGGSAV
jgi:hypothetical protein